MNMLKNKKLFFVLLAVPFLLFVFNVQFVSAQDNSILIAQLEQKIQVLLRQIIAIIQEKIRQASLQNATQSNLQNQNGQATLTINASGTPAYVSINNGPQFPYSSQIVLNDGDTYAVTASHANGQSSSTSKCSGKASAGGKYTCNIAMDGY